MLACCGRCDAKSSCASIRWSNSRPRGNAATADRCNPADSPTPATCAYARLHITQDADSITLFNFDAATGTLRYTGESYDAPSPNFVCIKEPYCTGRRQVGLV
jgi:hypothetical protein